MVTFVSGLIVLEPGDRIRIPRTDLVRWRDRGPLRYLGALAPGSFVPSVPRRR